ncbi:MAG: polyprenyl synthetase family protein [Acidobacteriota bacterium]|jgi:geranylgeranyl pyrophosphate synthase
MADPAVAFLEGVRARVDRTLDALLPAAEAPPARFHAALRHPVFAGGKRIRPALFLATVRALAGDEDGALIPAAALELVHTYSLVHDDLPAMDDDDLRRGKPTTHVAFDEATAILVGDGLLTLAFEALAARTDAPAEVRTALCAELALAGGIRGMIAGQVLDMEAEGSPPDGEGLLRIHRLKTGALIRASVVGGAIFAGAGPAETEAARGFGEAIGLAFQIVDDVLDVEGRTEVLGKTAGKDRRAAKATFPALWGLEGAREKAAEALAEATDRLAPLGDRAALLLSLARFVVQRDR